MCRRPASGRSDTSQDLQGQRLTATASYPQMAIPSPINPGQAQEARGRSSRGTIQASTGCGSFGRHEKDKHLLRHSRIWPPVADQRGPQFVGPRLTNLGRLSGWISARPCETAAKIALPTTGQWGAASPRAVACLKVFAARAVPKHDDRQKLLIALTHPPERMYPQAQRDPNLLPETGAHVLASLAGTR